MRTIVATAIGGSKCIGSRAGPCRVGERLMNSRFYIKIEAMTGQKLEAKPRGRPQKNYYESSSDDVG